MLIELTSILDIATVEQKKLEHVTSLVTCSIDEVSGKNSLSHDVMHQVKMFQKLRQLDAVLTVLAGENNSRNYVTEHVSFRLPEGRNTEHISLGFPQGRNTGIDHDSQPETPLEEKKNLLQDTSINQGSEKQQVNEEVRTQLEISLKGKKNSNKTLL